MRFVPILFFMEFAEQILAWYPNHKRTLPWRNIQNPYYIWLSEVILQQTRVKQGLPYYEAFISLFPTIQDLANAPEELVMRTWQGLGYYSRARNMHSTAKYIAQELRGVFPQTQAELIKLKGIGTYTAAAVASFAFGEQVAVVDGNVFRVLARFFGMEDDISSPKGVKQFQALAQMLLPTQQASTYNQAMMEFGALQCTPQKPNCMYCPLQTNCVAFATSRQGILPVKTNKIKQKERFFHYLILQHQDKYAMRKRGLGDIWAGLYDFALTEFAQETPLHRPATLPALHKIKHESKYYKHVLTHQILRAKFWLISVEEQPILNTAQDSFEWYSLAEIQNLPKPILIANVINEILL